MIRENVGLAPLAEWQAEGLVAQLPFELEPVLVAAAVLEEVVPEGGLAVSAAQPMTPHPLNQVADAGYQHVFFAACKRNIHLKKDSRNFFLIWMSNCPEIC